MNWTLEVVCVPVTDVDRAKAYYADRLGFHVNFDITHDKATRVVQLTPPGSGCSTAIGSGIFDWPGAPVRAVTMEPGSLHGLRLVVRDIVAPRAELAGRAVDVTRIQVYGSDLRLHPYRDGGELPTHDPRNPEQPDKTGRPWPAAHDQQRITKINSAKRSTSSPLRGFGVNQRISPGPCPIHSPAA